MDQVYSFFNSTIPPAFEQIKETAENYPITSTAILGVALTTLALAKLNEPIKGKLYELKYRSWVKSVENVIGKEGVQGLQQVAKDLAQEKITLKEFDEKFSSTLIDSQSPAYQSLIHLQSHYRQFQPKWEWDVNGWLVNPRDPQLSVHVEQYRVLMKRLNELLPDNHFSFDEYHPNYDKGALEKMKRPVSWEDIEKTCFDLLDHSLEISEAVCNDLEHWNSHGGIKGRTQALLLTRQRLEGGGTYLYKAFYHLPEAYRLIANLKLPETKAADLFNNPEMKRDYPQAFEAFKANITLVPDDWNQRFFTPGTKQSEYREKYHAFADRILQLAGGAESLDAADVRFTPWISKHEEGQPFYVRPSVRPT